MCFTEDIKLKWALIQQNGYPYKEGKQEKCTEERHGDDAQGEDSHIQNKEKDLKDILPLLPLEDTNFDDT